MKDFTIKNRLKHKGLKNFLTNAAAISVWLLLWQGAYLYKNMELVLPYPIQVMNRLVTLISTDDFWSIISTSFTRIMLGYLIGVVVGVVIAILTSSSKIIYRFFYPALSTIKATPVASFIILALVWLTSTRITVFMTFLMVLPIVWGNVHTAIQKVDESLLQMAQVFQLGAKKILFKIYIPSVLPFFVTACTTSLGLAWKAGIAAEVLAIPQNSIGRQIYNSKIYMETADLFAWTIVVIIMSILIEKTLVSLIERFVKKT